MRENILLQKNLQSGRSEMVRQLIPSSNRNFVYGDESNTFIISIVMSYGSGLTENYFKQWAHIDLGSKSISPIATLPINLHHKAFVKYSQGTLVILRDQPDCISFIDHKQIRPQKDLSNHYPIADLSQTPEVVLAKAENDQTLIIVYSCETWEEISRMKIDARFSIYVDGSLSSSTCYYPFLFYAKKTQTFCANLKTGKIQEISCGLPFVCSDRFLMTSDAKVKKSIPDILVQEFARPLSSCTELPDLSPPLPLPILHPQQVQFYQDFILVSTLYSFHIFQKQGQATLPLFEKCNPPHVAIFLRLRVFSCPIDTK